MRRLILRLTDTLTRSRRVFLVSWHEEKVARDVGTRVIFTKVLRSAEFTRTPYFKNILNKYQTLRTLQHNLYVVIVSNDNECIPICCSTAIATHTLEQFK